MSTRIERITIAALATFIAISAAGGAVGLIGGGLAFPPEWLEGTPFSSYVGPALILGIVVGGSALLAAAMIMGRHSMAAPVAFGAGAIQIGWIVGEVVLVGTHGDVMLWLQVIYGLAGALLAVFALDVVRRIPRTGPAMPSGARA